MILLLVDSMKGAKQSGVEKEEQKKDEKEQKIKKEQ
jgi:hypothetical protein